MMPSDTFNPKNHPAPPTSWWATSCSFEAWTVLQQLAQKRISRTGRPYAPGGNKPTAPVPPDVSF